MATWRWVIEGTCRQRRRRDDVAMSQKWRRGAVWLEARAASDVRSLLEHLKHVPSRRLEREKEAWRRVDVATGTRAEWRVATWRHGMEAWRRGDVAVSQRVATWRRARAEW